MSRPTPGGVAALGDGSEGPRWTAAFGEEVRVSMNIDKKNWDILFIEMSNQHEKSSPTQF